MIRKRFCHWKKSKTAPNDDTKKRYDLTKSHRTLTLDKNKYFIHKSHLTWMPVLGVPRDYYY